MQIIYLQYLGLRKILEALPPQEQNFEFAQSFARSYASHVLQHLLEVLPQSEIVAPKYFMVDVRKASGMNLESNMHDHDSRTLEIAKCLIQELPTNEVKR